MVIVFKEVLRSAFLSWIKNKEMQKYLIILSIVTFVLNALAYYGVFLSFGNLTQTSTTQEVILALVAFAPALMVLMVLSVLAFTFMYMLIYVAAMKFNKLTTIQLNSQNYLKFLFYGLFESVAAIFSIYHKKFLLVLGGAILAMLIGMVVLAIGSGNGALIVLGILLLVVSFLLFSAYLVVLIYNCYRLIVSTPAFFAKPIGIMASLKSSWELTRGNVLNIFIVMLLVGLFSMVPIWVAGIPTQMMQVSIAGSGTFNEALATLSSPAMFVLMIPSSIAQAYVMIAQVFALISVYSMLSGGSKKAIVVKPKSKVVKVKVKKKK